MLSRKTIDAVEQLSITQVIGKYVSLKRAGAQHKGKSPFTDEKSGSFMVSESKNIWKCFSSGKGGKGCISFVMDFLSASYIDAIKDIAAKNSIEIEYDDSERAKKYIEVAQKKKTIYEVNALALEFFTDNIVNAKKEDIRVSDEIVEKFSIGYAPDEWKALFNFLISKGVSKEVAVQSGLIKKSAEKENYFDFFRGRIMFPIHDESGKIIGFSGRDITGNKDAAKYLNSSDSEVYSKSNSILGFFLSKKEIQKKDFVVKAEGNFDCARFHQFGIENALAPLGTAFTKYQAELIGKYSKNWILAIDNDEAGIRSAEKDINLLLELGYFVEIWVPESEENKTDPDSFLAESSFDAETFPKYLKENKKDAVLWLAKSFFEDAKTPIEKTKAENKLSKLLSSISNAQLRNTYVRDLVKVYKIDKASIEKNVSVELATRNIDDSWDIEEKGYKLPSFLKEDDRADWEEFGFYQLDSKKDIGYYFPTAGFTFERISNFIIKPLFQVEARQDSKRLVEIQNAQKSKLISLPNKAFVNAQLFEEIVSNEGEFWFDGTKKHFQKLRRKLLAKFPFSFEIKTLGWQKHNFFSFANGIAVDGVFKEIDINGLVEYNDVNYFLPAFSRLGATLEKEEDIYHSDRDFIYRKGSVSFLEWSNLMLRVHRENGMWSIMYFVTALFRDFVFQKKSIFPILYHSGQPSTGKSACARSINSIFLGLKPPYNINQGTSVAFTRSLSRGRNTVFWIDEFSPDIDPKKIENIKSVFDGAGHEKGVMSNDNRTTTTTIESALQITSQYLPIGDDNLTAIFTRIILLTYERKQEDLSPEDIIEFNKLAKLQQTGLSNIIVEVVKYRDLFVEQFENVQYDVLSNLKKDLEGKEYHGRILESFSFLLASHQILVNSLKIPFTYKTLYDSALIMIQNQSESVVESDVLAGFWKMFSFMIYNYQIQVNTDFKVIEETSITVRKGRDQMETIRFETPKKVLYIHLTKVHPLYMQEHRKQLGKNGITEQSIKSFMKTSKAYIGNVAMFSFEGSRTSAYAFDLSKLNVTIKTNPGAETQKPEPTPVPIPHNMETQDELPF